jgi:rRNA maturation protein Rpf1
MIDVRITVAQTIICQTDLFLFITAHKIKPEWLVVLNFNMNSYELKVSSAVISGR